MSSKVKPKELSKKSAGGSGRVSQQSRPSQGQQHILESHGFILGERVGKGSYGDVWKAYSADHRSIVAVKVVSKQKAPPDFLEKFLPREIEIIKILQHPNIINFLLSIETNKSVYMIMEMATGGTLLDVIKKDRYLDEQRACRWFHHLIEGITYIHGKGYVHRDLKCENMLLDKHGTLKIIDFGFAKGGLNIDVEVTSPTDQLSSTFCGSYAYACTEILKKIPYEAHLADMWSMGVILFVMLYGRFPFNSSNLANLVKQTQKPIDFPDSPTTTIEAKKLISRILKPEKQRIYLPEVKRDKWYTSASYK